MLARDTPSQSVRPSSEFLTWSAQPTQLSAELRYGKGLYFCESATKADEYARDEPGGHYEPQPNHGEHVWARTVTEGPHEGLILWGQTLPRSHWQNVCLLTQDPVSNVPHKSVWVCPANGVIRASL